MPSHIRTNSEVAFDGRMRWTSGNGRGWYSIHCLNFRHSKFVDRGAAVGLIRVSSNGSLSRSVSLLSFSAPDGVPIPEETLEDDEASDKPW